MATDDKTISPPSDDSQPGVADDSYPRVHRRQDIMDKLHDGLSGSPPLVDGVIVQLWPDDGESHTDPIIMSRRYAERLVERLARSLGRDEELQP